MNFPTPIMISKVQGVCRIERRVFVGAHDFAEYIASLGPVECADHAGGVLHPNDPEVMLIPVGGECCAVIDTEDYPLVKGYAWHINNSGYVQSAATYEGKQRHVLMHRLVMMVGPSLIVDHKDHNPQNNRKSNLRPCTAVENNWNARLSSANKSGFKGVVRNGTKWRGRVGAEGVEHYKNFSTKEEANEWARAKRIELHGEFACHGGAV